MEFVCLNCRIRFSAEEATRCPRCSSKNLRKIVKAEKEAFPKTQQATEKQEKQKIIQSAPRIYGDTKAAWKSFHETEQKNCPNCGSSDFQLDFKHKEKICLKCGAIVSMRRRVA